MNPPSKDIKAILVAAGIVTANEVYLYEEPETPDALVSMFDQSGMAPNNIADIFRPMVQIRVRGEKRAYETTYAKVVSMQTYLMSVAEAEVNSAHYIGIWATSDVLFLGFDENERPQFSINFIINRSPI